MIQPLLSKLTIASFLFATGILSFACSGGSEEDGDEVTPGESELRTRLGKCPVVGTTSDKEAFTCLVGSYAGKTLGGADCSLQIEAGGAYSFVSPNLSINNPVETDDFFLFARSSSEGSDQIIWKANDKLSVDDWYQLSFEAVYGSALPENLVKLQIDLDKNNGSEGVSCIVPL